MFPIWANRHDTCCCITAPFELGIRHFIIACCDGKPATIQRLMKERVIHQFSYSYTGTDNPTYRDLTKCERAVHIVLGLLETVGYITIVLPFIVAFAEGCY